MRTQRALSLKGRARYTLAAALGVALLPGHDVVRAQGQDKATPARLVHVLKTRGVGVPRPMSLAHGPSGAFVMVASRGGAFTDLVLVSHELSVVGRVRIDAALGGLNMAFDARGRRLLAFEPREARLSMVPLDPAGRLLDGSRLASVVAHHFGVQDAQGMAVDPRSGHVFILDAAGSRLVRVEPDADGRFEAARVAEVALQSGGARLRGLALHPGTGHLYALSPEAAALLEFEQTGALVTTRDVSKAGLRSPQAMTFAPSGDSTDASTEQNLFIADAGHLTGSETVQGPARTSPAGAGLVELSLAAPVAPAPESLLSTALLVNTTLTSDFNPPSPDPSGIEYIAHLGAGSGRLWISDGEVEETPLFAGKNVFETTPGGTLVNTYSTTAFSQEPVGVGVNSINHHLFYSDDDTRRVFEIDPGGDDLYHTIDDTRTTFQTISFGANDPEGIAFDSTGNTLFIAGGEDSEIWIVTPGLNGVFDGGDPTGDDVVDHFDTLSQGVVDPEAIAFNPDNGHLYVLGNAVNEVAEFDPATGMVVQTIDISAAKPVKTAGIAYGPTSTDPTARSLYIVDRGIDNNSNPTENDGRLYELAINYTTPPNIAPLVSAGLDQTITFPAAAVLDGTVGDDGLPAPPASTTVTWSKLSGPGNVTFVSESSVDTSASFSVAGTYVLRLTASDSLLSTSDDVSIAVLAPNEVRVSFGADDAEERVNGTVALGNNDLELVNNTEGGVTGDQTVGLRFRGIPIVQGATITNAYVQFQADEAQSGATNLVIQGQDADNAAIFAKMNGNISSRPRTSAFATWSPPAWTIGAAGPAQRTGNIASVIQEIVDRPGWASGNSLVLIITGTGKRVAEPFEGAPLGAALLHIESNSPPPSNQPPSVNAGPDLAATLPDLATLDGFATDDGLPHPPGLVTTTWSKFSGPGTVTFGNANELETYAIFSEAGNYVLRLTASDSVLSASDDVTVTVNEEGQSTLSVVQKGAIHTATDATTYSFPSFQALDDHLYVVFLNTAIGSGTAPAATSVTGAGLTFTEIGAAGGLTYSGAGVRRVQAWRALSSGGAQSGQITISLNGTSIGMDAVLLEFSGMDTSGTNGEGAIAQSATIKGVGVTSLTVPLAAFAHGSNRPVAFFSHRVNELTTPEAGYTELDDAGHATPAHSSFCEWDAATAETSPSASWGTAADAVGFAIEVRIANSAPPPNQPPVVDAGPNDAVTLPASANLNGTVTDDDLPNPPGVVTTTWSKFSGAGNVTFGNANAVDTSATFSLPGTYVLRLTADDGDLTTSDDVTIIVTGQAPLAVVKLATIHSSTDATSYSFSSVAASNNRLYVVFLNTAIGSGTAPAATGVSGAGLTFSEIDPAGGELYSGAGVRRMQAWRALVGSGATTGAITINLNGSSIGMDAVLLEFTGTDTTGVNGAGAIVQSQTAEVNAGNSVSVTLGAFGSGNNRPVAFFSHRIAEASTEEAGYTELDDVTHSAPTTGTACEWNATAAETSPSASWVTAADGAGFALEVKKGP
jgi:uncharacterized protein YjiK